MFLVRHRDAVADPVIAVAVAAAAAVAAAGSDFTPLADRAAPAPAGGRRLILHRGRRRPLIALEVDAQRVEALVRAESEVDPARGEEAREELPRLENPAKRAHVFNLPREVHVHASPRGVRGWRPQLGDGVVGAVEKIAVLLRGQPSNVHDVVRVESLLQGVIGEPVVVRVDVV